MRALAARAALRALLPVAPLTLLLLLAACRGGPQDVQVQPGSATPPAVSSPLDTPPSGSLALPVPPALPLPASQPDAIDVADGLATTVTWLLPDDDPGKLAESLAQRVVAAPGVELRLAELGAGGGIIVFGAAVDGHYLVTAGANGGARVELHLDPPAGESRRLGAAVALPAGYPVDAVPIYPGAVVVEAREAPLADDLTRFELVLETRRAAVEATGFYADHLVASGWTVDAASNSLEATRGRASVSVVVTGEQPAVLRIVIEWPPGG